MSRATAPSPMQPQATPAKPQQGPMYEEIAKRAYEKWCKRGKPHGQHTQDWFEAEAELKREFSMGYPATPQRR